MASQGMGSATGPGELSRTPLPRKRRSLTLIQDKLKAVTALVEKLSKDVDSLSLQPKGMQTTPCLPLIPVCLQ